MLLVIDIGNTNVKMGVFKDKTLVASWRFSSSRTRTSDEYWLYLVSHLKENGVNKSDITDVIIGSVVPNLNYTFSHLCEYSFGIKPVMLDHNMAGGLKTKYSDPRRLGADRIAVTLAAVRDYGAPLIVIDYGTATTFNVVNKDGEFIGGAIFTGIKTALDNLIKGTAQLPNIELSLPGGVIGTDTVGNMQSGFTYGFIGMTEYMVARIKEEEDIACAKVIATGGLAEVIASGTKIFDCIDRQLSLKGLFCAFSSKNLTSGRKGNKGQV